MQKNFLCLIFFTLSLFCSAPHAVAAETTPEPIPKIQDMDHSYANEEAEDARAYPSDYSHAQSRINVIKSKLPGRLALDGSHSVIVNTEGYNVETHIDMKGRHQLLSPGESNNGSFNNHGVHTAGIIAGNGNRNPRFEGVAPGSLLYSVIGDKFPMGLHESPPARISTAVLNRGTKFDSG